MYVAEAIKEVSNNYTSDCYVMKVDIKGFFMSIDRQRICDKVTAIVAEHYSAEDKDALLFLLRRVLLNAPEKHCRRCGDLSLWRHIKPHKSLFTNGEGKGLPIGDLVVQMAANILLNDTDHFITDMLDIKMARYVDDMVLIHQDKDYLLRAVPKIRTLLLQTAGVELHPHKFYIQHYTKGVKFVGAVIKPHRTYVANRTVNNAFASIRRLHKSRARVEDIVASVNSYLGIMRHHRTYRIRQRLCRLISKRFDKKVIVEYNHKKINDRRTKTAHSLTRGTGARAHRLRGVAEDAKACREGRKRTSKIERYVWR